MFTDITLIDYGRPLVERAKARKIVGPYHWAPAKPGDGRGFYQSADYLECDARGSTFALRLEYASAFLPAYSRNISHQGYACDDAGTYLIPIVARLPHDRGFLAGWTMGKGMPANLEGHIWRDAEDAARDAHEIANRDAEREREYQENLSDDES